MNRTLIAASAVAATLAGCATDPYAEDPKPLPPAGEEPSKPVEQPRDRIPATAYSPTPEAAGRRAAELAGNWTRETVVDRYTELARHTIGQARDAAQQVAAQADTDPQLTAPGARSIAIVHAVTAYGRGRKRRLIIVTHETVTADPIRDSRWRVTVAEAERREVGWAVSRWEPQP